MNKLSFNAGSPLFTGVIAVIFSVLMIAWPGVVVRSMIAVLGWLMIIIGGLPVLYALIRKYQVPSISVIYLVCGILVLIFKDLFLNIAMWLLGIILILGAIQQFNILVAAKKMGYQPKAYTYLYSGVLLLAGVITLINPFASLETLVMFFGFALLFYGVTLLLNEIMIQRSQRKYTDYKIEK